jgi:NhaC family Na+:H+ antiporter
MNPAMVAGAVISGAYLGDKLSPMSDTTNLAAGVAKANLFDHVRRMAVPTAIAGAIALILFTLMGVFGKVSGNIDSSTIEVIRTSLAENYTIH